MSDMNSHSIPPKSQPQGLGARVETLELAVQFASRKPKRPHPRTKEEYTLGAELLLVLEDVGLRAWVLAIAQRCYDCEECCSQSFDF